jgi:hypothetical protein
MDRLLLVVVTHALPIALLLDLFNNLIDVIFDVFAHGSNLL